MPNEKTDADQLWSMVHAERAALATDLESLTAEQWRHPTLCGEWDVEQVVAHLIAVASVGQWRWFRSMLAAGLRPSVHNRRRLEEHRGSTPAATLDRFREIITSTIAPSADTAAYLGEVLVHAQDIRQPLGIDREPQVEALTPVAVFYASRNFAVQSRKVAAGLRLEANDGPFAAGSGPLVSGSTLGLVMAMAGRGGYVDRLDGTGVDGLRARLET